MTHHTAAGVNRLRATASERIREPGVQERLHAAREAKMAWSDEHKATVAQWAADGVTVQQMAARTGVGEDAMRARARKYGIDLRGPHLARYADGGAVLVQHYETTMPLREVHSLYTAARGCVVTPKALFAHARKLKLRRSHSGVQRATQFAAERVAYKSDVQRMLNAHATVRDITTTLGMSETRLRSMLRHEEVTRPAPPPRATKVKPPRIVAVKPPKPRKMPASYTRAPTKPAKPKPVYESVEAWLAAGNTATRCPTAMLVASQATIPAEDRAEMTALYAQRERDRPKGRNGAAMKDAVKNKLRWVGWAV